LEIQGSRSSGEAVCDAARFLGDGRKNRAGEEVMNRVSSTAALNLLGRVLLVAIFLPEAWVKIRGYDAALAYMVRFGVPGVLLPLVIAVEIVAPILIIVGWQTRAASFALAGFCLVTALIFHADFANPNQELHFWKNVAMAGGFIVLQANGAGAWALDARMRKDT
jgi:putative oxidoreductase